MKALHAAQSCGVVSPKKAFVFGHMVILNWVFYTGIFESTMKRNKPKKPEIIYLK